MIRDSNHKKDKALFVKAAFSDFMDDAIQKDNKQAISRLIARHTLKLNKQHFAQLHELCNSCTKNDVQFRVQSIDSIKGLDADTCVIILSSSTLKYLTQDGISKANRFNKEWKKVYVALTRAKKRLVLALDHDLLAKEDMAAVRSSIGALGFVYHD
ncbi:AAA domain-containing protein [Photobacterium damselae]